MIWTENDWLELEHIGNVICGGLEDLSRQHPSALRERKLRFLTTVCVAPAVERRPGPAGARVLEAFDQYSDGLIEWPDLERVMIDVDTQCEAIDLLGHPWGGGRDYASHFNRIDDGLLWLFYGLNVLSPDVWGPDNIRLALQENRNHSALYEHGSWQVNYLHCIVGNPFRPVACDPAWRSSDVVALAEAIYAEQAFDRLPILADALEEAGCDHPDVLAHCRGDGPGPHARGCWVVDLVLGKV